MEYKGWTIEYNPKPMPDRRFDYDVTHDEFDGENGGDYFFNAPSVDDAKLEIDERCAIGTP